MHPDVPDGMDCDLAEPRHFQTGVIQLVLLGCLDPEKCLKTLKYILGLGVGKNGKLEQEKRNNE